MKITSIISQKLLKMLSKIKFNYSTYDLSKLVKIINDNDKFLITGGRSVDYFLKKAIDKKKVNKKKKFFYLSDERISSDSKNTNFFKIQKYIKKRKNISFIRIDNFSKNLIQETEKYSKKLSKKIDVAFLSLGEKFHIASLFYNQPIIYSSKYACLTYSEDFDFLRISVNKKLLSKIKKIYLFINGKNKLKQFNLMVKKNILDFYFDKKSQKNINLIFKDINN
jgi:6-phosphogluconolactonase/glucosamine-6-phosphate isomerase/deaminase